MGNRVYIFDTTLRDGEQSPGASLTIDEKLIVARQLERLGVDVIEAGFPISSEGDFKAVNMIAKEIKDSIVCGLSRALPKDIDVCWEAVKEAENPRIHTFIATSNIHMQKKLQKKPDEVIEMAVEAVKRAKRYCSDVEFSLEDATRTDYDFMCRVVRETIRAGATVINIPDTVGYAIPKEFANRIKYLFDNVAELDEVILSVHCHDDLGNAVSNSLIAVEMGARQVECCVNGIGERAGNAALEEVVMNLVTRKDYFGLEVGINTKEIYRTSRMVSELTGIEVQRNKAIVGKNAFAHESGIHQHGVISSKETYEIMKPEVIGWEGENLVIGKHSGRHAIKLILEKEGYRVSKEQLDMITKHVKALADKQKTIEKVDLLAIANDVIGRLSENQARMKLKEFNVVSGSGVTPTASVRLQIGDEEKIGSGIGVGPVDALSNAILSIIGSDITLEEYNLKSVTGGANALAKVTVKVRDREGNVVSATGVDEDIMKASASAIIEGLNKIFSYGKG